MGAQWRCGLPMPFRPEKNLLWDLREISRAPIWRSREAFKWRRFLGALRHIYSAAWVGRTEGAAQGRHSEIGQAQTSNPLVRISETVLLTLKPRRVLRVTDGPQFNRFPKKPGRCFFAARFA